MIQTPSLKVLRVQVLDETLHVTLVEPIFAAVTVAVPVNVPVTFIVGVLSFVRSSLLELPESDEVAKSGLAGLEIVDLFITTFASAVLVSELIPPKD